jgi:hypothetical protein
MLRSAAATRTAGLLLVLVAVSSATLPEGDVNPESSAVGEKDAQVTTNAADRIRKTKDRASIGASDSIDGGTKANVAGDDDVATTPSAEAERNSHRPDAELVDDQHRMTAGETETDAGELTADEEEAETSSQEQEQMGPEAREYDDDGDEEENGENENDSADDEASGTDVTNLDLNNVDLKQFDVIEKRILIDERGNSLKSTSRHIAVAKRGSAKQSPTKARRKNKRKRQGPLSLRRLRAKRRKGSPPAVAGSSKPATKKPKKRNRKRETAVTVETRQNATPWAASANATL